MIGIKASSLKATVGETWSSISQAQLSSANGPIDTRAMAYGNGYYVVQIRPSGLVYATHPSGPWTINTNSTWTFNDVCQITYENGYWFVPSRSTTSLYLADITGTGTSFTNASLRKVIWHSGSSKWVGINGTAGYSFATSVATWTAGVQLGTGATTDIATDGTTLVAVTNAGELYTSTNPTSSGTSWTSRTSSFGTTPIRSVKYNAAAGYWVACGDSGTIAYSTNATAWTQKASGVANTSTSSFYHVVYFNGKWFINDLTNSDIIASSGSNPSTSTYSVVLDAVSKTQYFGVSDIFVWTTGQQGTASTTVYASR